jgi:hypothetical protein
MNRDFFLGCVGWFSTLCASAAALGGEVDFNRDIRPILSQNCFQCHGPDEKARQAGLRLDRREDAVRATDSGAVAVAPGRPEQSELLRRVSSSDEYERMPPPDSGKELTHEQLALLRAWIEQGAKYQGHWAFIAPERPELPEVEDARWPRGPIDRFVLARLEAEGLHPAPEARRETLIRRLALDLTGTPPTLDEIDAFLADQSPGAYERLVDRLLASPRYGERMAIQWLDFARYADSHGFQDDSSRYMWPWRDWVIRAFNENMPFDQFTIEQLAGDLLPRPTQSQLVATGFNRNHRLNGEAGLIAEEWRVETVIDRVETTSNTWMALTLGCCRCHDHKFDPISQKEFYRFFAFFNNIEESGTLVGSARNEDPVITVANAKQQAELARLRDERTKAERHLAEVEKQLPALVAAWEGGFRQQLKETPRLWTPLEPRAAKSLGGATLTRRGDGTWLASGVNPDFDTYEITAPLAAGRLSALLLETFPDAGLPKKSLGRYSNGNYVLSAVEIEIAAPSLSEPRVGKLGRVEADYSQKGWDIQLLLDDNPRNGWAVDGPTNRDPHQALFVLETPLAVPDDATLTVRLKHEALKRHNIGRFRLQATGAEPAAVTLDGDGRPPAAIVAILDAPRENRSREQNAALEKFFRENTDNPVKRADSAVAAAKKAHDAYQKSLPTTMVMKEMPRPRAAFVLKRGEYDKRGEQVAAGLPAILPPMPDGAPMNRLGLARWLVDPSHPLTARVWVNRAWERFFGTGLVKTSGNLGSQGEWPSHPQLLDWMATEFVRLDWDMKAMQKQIVMSATYRQASGVSPELLERDPENRLLARGPRFRLPAEVIRDQALAISGLLVERLGGPTVRPYMPPGVWNETSRYGDLRNYKHDQGAGLYRRTMYTIWKRTAAPPTLLLFDAPNREVCTVRRARTNTPLQALALLNEVTYVEAARKLAERMIREGGDRAETRLAHGFRLATARFPESEELKVLADGLATDLARYRADPAAAKKLLAEGESQVAPGLDAAELAAYTLAANVILNLDEVITRE